MRAGIIFDLDGTLANSEPIHERALRKVSQDLGMSLSPEQFIELCVGVGDLPSLANIARANNQTLTHDQLLEMSSAKHQAFAEILTAEGVPAYDGAAELVRAAAHRVPVAVCSGSRRQTVMAVLDALGLADVPRAIVTLDDVTQGKPHPEPYLRTADVLGLSPELCVALEDTPSGARSALDAGVGVVAVEHSVPRSELANVHRVVEHISHLSVDDLLSV